jgi:peroxiredoxin
MRSILLLSVGVALLLAVVGSAADQAPEEKTGLKVGAQAPAFTLQDQAGNERTLDEFLKQGNVALVFYRSASWWPYCQKQLVQLQADLKNIQATGTTVVGISYDPVEALAEFADKRQITFPLLTDPDSKTINAYRLLNKEAKRKAEGIPYPGTFLIDKDGVIRAKLFVDGYRERHSVNELLRAVEAIKNAPENR